MKPIVIFVTLLWSPTFAGASSAVKPDLPEVDRVQKAFEKLVRCATDADWQSVAAARKAFGSLGQAAVPKLTEAARSHGEARVRRACYELLTNEFAKDERAVDTVIKHGLADQDPGIRYECAFLLGDLKVHRADRALRAALDRETGSDSAFLRQTLAKSLAQLGEADILLTLFAAVTDDSFMSRHVGNIGLKALSGKNLEDFEKYQYAEGDCCISGFEFKMPIDAITFAEKKAQRFRAATAYFKWLKSEHPELYKYATYRRRG
jgi:HEAT repeat protein